MTTMTELREKSAQDLQSMLRDLLTERFKLRMQSGEQTPRTHLFSRIRKDIARIRTVMNERTKGEQNESSN